MAPPTRKEIDEFRMYVSALVDESTRDLAVLKFDQKAQHLALALLYCTIVQSAHECLALLREASISVPGILRGLLESYADLCAVTVDPNYPERMLATFYAEKIRHLKSMIAAPANVYHAEVRKQLDPNAELPNVESDLKVMVARGFAPLSNRERLEAGGLLAEYQSFYWQLCLESHNSLSSLESRHIETVDGEISLVLRKESSVEDLARSYDALIGVLLESAIKAHTLLNSSLAPKYERWSRELRSFREGLGERIRTDTGRSQEAHT